MLRNQKFDDEESVDGITVEKRKQILANYENKIKDQLADDLKSKLSKLKGSKTPTKALNQERSSVAYT
jgi:FKBP-type peptidyl-prolyl cis-trans isomerase (trigger factor)